MAEFTGNPFEEDLTYVRTKRKAFIDTLEKQLMVSDEEGEGEETDTPPAPPAEGEAPKKKKVDLAAAKVYLAGLADMDRAALTNKRIKSDEGAVDKLVTARETITMLFNDPRIKDFDRSAVPVPRAAPKLPEGLVEVTLVPGELDQSSGTEDYKGFMARMQPTA